MPPKGWTKKDKGTKAPVPRREGPEKAKAPGPPLGFTANPATNAGMPAAAPVAELDKRQAPMVDGALAGYVLDQAVTVGEDAIVQGSGGGMMHAAPAADGSGEECPRCKTRQTPVPVYLNPTVPMNICSNCGAQYAQNALMRL